MSKWETIQDKSSHLSPIKFTLQRDHSAERVDDMIEAVYKSTHTKTKAVKAIPKPNISIKQLTRLTIGVLLVTMATVQWQCTKGSIQSSLCEYKLDIQPRETMNKVRQLKDEYLDKINFNWPTEQYEHAKDYYTVYVQPNVNWIKECIYAIWIDFQDQFDRYVESGRPKSSIHHHIEKDDKYKATAKRIVDYFNKSDKSGMNRDEAREKAKEILNSLFPEKKDEVEQVQKVADDDMDKVAFKIQSIMKTAMIEKAELDKQLSLIQSTIQDGSFNQHETHEDFELFIAAVKSELEGLRMKAENKVREKTKLAISSTYSENPIVNQHIKEDFLSSQKAALKDLRQIYIKLYQTNKMIDELSFSI